MTVTIVQELAIGVSAALENGLVGRKKCDGCRITGWRGKKLEMVDNDMLDSDFS